MIWVVIILAYLFVSIAVFSHGFSDYTGTFVNKKKTGARLMLWSPIWPVLAVIKAPGALYRLIKAAADG